MTVAVLGPTLFDALGTIVLVGTGVAEEANPLVAGLHVVGTVSSFA